MKQKKKAKIIIILLVILTVLFTTITFAKYLQENTIKSSTKIAKPIMEIENGEKLNITNTQNEGSYNFKVKNYNDKNEITDVNLNYNIEIISNTDETVKYELYKDNEKIDISNNKSQNIKLSKDFLEEHNYILKISYDKSYGYNTYDILEDVQIKIHSEQERL